MSDAAVLADAEHPNAIRVRELVNALRTGDIDAVVAQFSDDATYRMSGDSRVSGTSQGHAPIRAALASLSELAGGALDLELHDVLADDHHAVCFGTLDVGRDGTRLQSSSAMAFIIEDDGRIAEAWFFSSDQRAFDDFFR